MRYILYKKQNAKGTDQPLQLLDAEYDIKIQNCNLRAYLHRNPVCPVTASCLLFWLLSFGNCNLFLAYAPNGKLIHRSTVVGRCAKFPFLHKGEYEIGPCYTENEYRGRGIYPKMLTYIQNYYKDANAFLMLIREDNTSSRRGVEKAAFQETGSVRKKFGMWCRYE